MNKSFLILFSIIIISSISYSSVYGNMVLYEDPLDGNISGMSYIRDTIVAEDFVLTEASAIASVHFHIEAIFSPSTDTYFTIYQDGGNQPGEEIITGQLIFVERLDDPLGTGCPDCAIVSMDLPNPIRLNPGTYWIGLSFDPTTFFGFLTGDDDPVGLPIRTSADGGQTWVDGTFSLNFSITTRNFPPILDPIGDQQIIDASSLNVGITASDLNFDELSFNVYGLPPFATFYINGSIGANLILTPSCSDSGIYPIAVTVDDDGMPILDDGEAFLLTVEECVEIFCNKQISEFDAVIEGTELGELLQGTIGDDLIFGFGGDDRIYADYGNDCVFGGKGNDNVFGSLGNDEIYGGPGADEIWGAAGDDVIDGGLGNDNLRGNIGKDLIIGDSGNDYLTGGPGEDVLRGDEGDDHLWIFDGYTVLDGGPGMDICQTGSFYDWTIFFDCEF